MTLGRLPLALFAAAALTLTTPLRAQATDPDPDLRELLRDALYTEEVTRDPEAAAKQYEALLSKHDAQRAFAAAALFRLAEVRRKQDRKDEASALYQRLLREFPAAEAEGKLARENLATLDAKVEVPASPAGGDEEDKELSRLEALAITNPDTISDPSIAARAVGKSHLKILRFFIEKNPGFDFNRELDDQGTTLLNQASRAGALEACRMLLDAGADPNAPANRDALAEASWEGYFQIVELLLERSADPNGHGTLAPMRNAVRNNQPAILSLLVKHGADLNAPFATQLTEDGTLPLDTLLTSTDFGAPLHIAAARSDTRMLEMLLKLGADPNLAEQRTGLTALHIALYPAKAMENPNSMYKGNPEAVPILLKAGAKPDPETKACPLTNGSRQGTPTLPAGNTPLTFAVKSGNLASAEILIEAGASARRSGLLAQAIGQHEMLQLLLKHGANSNEETDRGDSVLLWAIMNNDLPSVRALLEAGADPNKGSSQSSPLANALFIESRLPMADLLLAKGAMPEASLLARAVKESNWNLAMRLLAAGAPLPNASTQFPWESPLVQAMKSAEALPLVEKLIELGAAPDDAWVRSGFDWLHYGSSNSIEIAPPIRAFLFRRFFLPVMEEHPGIRIIVHGPVRTTATLLDDPSPPLAPRPLAQALLDPAEAVPDVQRILSSDRLILWRKSTGQWSKADEFALDRESGYPDVHRGDVLELVHGPDPANRRDQPGGVGTIRPELEWTLRKRVTFPVTVEIDGKAREVTLRGDRLLFDPGFDQVPLVGASRLASLLWQPEVSHAGLPNPNPEVSVVRNGWPDISVPWNPSSPADFVLQSDDRLVIKTPPPPDHTREWHVAVRGSGLPFVRLYGANPRESSGPNEVAAASLPTLIQALADVGSYNTETLRSAPVDPAVLPSWLLGSPDLPIQLLPHPDYSKIVIRRLDAEGKETKIPVDLAAVIANSTAVTTPEQARKADVELQAGDIVEIPQVAGQAGNPWKGFTEAESRFFAKALDCKVQAIDLQGGIELREIRYQAPRFIELAGQWIPLPPTSGTGTLNAGWAIGQGSNTVKVTRMGKDSGALPASSVYLREGDVVKSSGRPPRARVVPSGR